MQKRASRVLHAGMILKFASCRDMAKAAKDVFWLRYGNIRKLLLSSFLSCIRFLCLVVLFSVLLIFTILAGLLFWFLSNIILICYLNNFTMLLFSLPLPAIYLFIDLFTYLFIYHCVGLKGIKTDDYATSYSVGKR